MMTMAAQTKMRTPADTSTPAGAAGLIHDDVLQSLGVAVLGIDLGRRLHQRMRYEQALDELTGIVEALDLALASTERLAPDLERLLQTDTDSPSRPSLLVVEGAPGAELDRPIAGPAEIVATLTASVLLARRCHHQYDAGLGEDTMRELELLLQRLEFVSAAFRTVMGQLRELSPVPVVPQPRHIAWVRSA